MICPSEVSDKSLGPDGISHRMLKTQVDQLQRPYLLMQTIQFVFKKQFRS